MESKYVTHDDLVQYVLKNKMNTYTTKPDAVRAINSVVRAIYDAILENDKVVLKNICVIDKKYWKPRHVLDKDSLEPRLKEECYTVGFSVNKILLNMVNKTLKQPDKAKPTQKNDTVVEQEVKDDNEHSQSRGTEETVGESKQVEQDSQPRRIKKSRKTVKERRRVKK